MLTISCINYTHFSLDELLQDNAALQKCFPLRDFQQYCEHIGNKKLKSTMMLKKQNTKEKQMKITRCVFETHRNILTKIYILNLCRYSFSQVKMM